MQSSHAEGRAMTKFICIAALALALGASVFVQLNTYAQVASLAAIGDGLTDAAPAF
jgi:hypothetical protein